MQEPNAGHKAENFGTTEEVYFEEEIRPASKRPILVCSFIGSSGPRTRDYRAVFKNSETPGNLTRHCSRPGRMVSLFSGSASVRSAEFFVR